MKINTKIKPDFFKVKPEEQISLVIFVVVVLCFVLGYFVLMPFASSYKANKISAIDLTNEKDSLLKKQTMLKNLGKDIENRKDFIEKTRFVLPTDPQVPEALVAIEKLASANSLYITSFVPKEEAKAGATANSQTKKDYKSMEVQFDVSGSYLDFKNFLEDLEKNIRPVAITSINVSGGGETSLQKEEVLKFNIKANIYYQ